MRRHIVAGLLMISLIVQCRFVHAQDAEPSATGTVHRSTTGSITYTNRKYGFCFVLPSAWNGYSIVVGRWTGMATDGSSPTPAIHGPELSIRNPRWTKTNPRQDIPIMIFTRKQWDLVFQEKIAVSAAPIGPSELGRNSRYVFALPPRYNYAFPQGYEEVERIIAGHPLDAF
ncbi:MAG: hypothetical protein JSS95_05255 [Acidobacteria bacterium]|nr:hypothetical protein [Acidobacteriota bacterium]